MAERIVSHRLGDRPLVLGRIGGPVLRVKAVAHHPQVGMPLGVEFDVTGTDTSDFLGSFLEEVGPPRPLAPAEERLERASRVPISHDPDDEDDLPPAFNLGETRASHEPVIPPESVARREAQAKIKAAQARQKGRR